jgi:DNA-binding GntR family transcriptional regulator
LKEAIINMELYSSREPQWIDERKISEQLGVSRTPAREVKPCWRRGFRHLNPT